MPQELSTWQEVALVAGPCFAAVSALASWAAVWNARRSTREEREPLLMVQKTVDPSTHTIGAVVTNAGGGAARGATVWLSHPPFRVETPLNDGFMFPGQRYLISTAIPATEVETDVLLCCRDGRRFAHFWNANEEHRIFKTRFRRRPRYRGDIASVFSEFHPGVDFEALGLVPSQVVKPSV